jgi:hypothetical protein
VQFKHDPAGVGAASDGIKRRNQHGRTGLTTNGLLVLKAAPLTNAIRSLCCLLEVAPIVQSEPGGTTATYTTAALIAGTHSITASYNSVTSNTVSQTVNKATPVITWATPAAIFYGTALGPAQLNASSNIPGAFVYSPASGTIPNLGSDTLSATFTPADTSDYTTAIATVTLIVNPATPVVTWASPANIPYGTALSPTQLDATSNVPGAFVYSPAAGTVLSVGPHTLTATFTPTDTTDYGNITATTYITVTDGMSKWDTGTVALVVNGSTVSTASYEQSSTPASIAAALASNLSAGSPVNVTDDALYLEAKTPGAASNSITYSLQNGGYDSTDFGQPSFPSSAESGSLEGGPTRAQLAELPCTAIRFHPTAMMASATCWELSTQ